MELIRSFSVDHNRIVPGIFTSRVDHLGDYSVTTYDIRLKRPNREPVINVAAMHSLEHIIATYLRNNPEWKDEVVYWGPMGCLTGFYLILKGNRASAELYDLMLSAFRAVADAQTVPGTAPETADTVSCTIWEWPSGTLPSLLNILKQMPVTPTFSSILRLKGL